jgi:hypothetical protein
VRHGLEQLYTRSNVEYPADWDWSTDWTDADEQLPAAALRQLPIFRLALALDAYAYYGLKLVIEEPNNTHDLDTFLDDLAWFPYEWGDKEMEQTLTAALARRKLDHPSVGRFSRSRGLAHHHRSKNRRYCKG